MRVAWWLWSVALFFLGCDYYAKPNRPLPSTFEARFLDGSPLDAEILRGKPTVINVWVPR